MDATFLLNERYTVSANIFVEMVVWCLPSATLGSKHGFKYRLALLFKVLSAKRWELLKVMTGAGPMDIRKAAFRLRRDEKGVHGDVAALLKAGVLQKTDKDLIVFPFDAMHVDFMLKAA